MTSNWHIYFILGILPIFVSIFFKDKRQFFLFLLVASIPLYTDFHLVSREPFTPGTVNGIPISLTDIFLGYLYFMWISELAFTKKTVFDFFPAISVPALGLVFAGFLSLMNSIVPILSVFMIIFLVKMFLLYLYLANNIRSEKDLKIVTFAIMLNVIAQSGLSYVEYFAHISFDITSLNFVPHEVGRSLGLELRPRATWGGSDNFGAFLTIFLPMCLLLRKIATEQHIKKLPTICFFMGLLSLTLTLSRGAWISFALSLALLVKLGPRGLLRTRQVVFIIIAISIVFMIFYSKIVFRVTDPTGVGRQSRLSRIPLMKTALNMVESHPVIGVGLNNYSRAMYHYIPSGLEDRWVYIVHNRLLLIWAETGTIGLLFYLWFWIAILKTGLGRTHSSTDFPSIVAFSITIGLLGHTFHLMVETMNGADIVSLKWFLAGVVASASNLRDSVGAMELKQINGGLEKTLAYR